MYVCMCVYVYVRGGVCMPAGVTDHSAAAFSNIIILPDYI